MENNFRSSSVGSKNYPKTRGYSTFDPGSSIDSGLDDKDASIRNSDNATAVEDTRERVSISWKNIDVLVEVPRPSFLKRLCFGTEEHEKPARKQVLFNGKCIFIPFRVTLVKCILTIFCIISRRQQKR